MIQILYATQTGNSEFYASQIGRTLQNTIVSSIEDYDVINLPESQQVIFIISTTGDGDMPNVMNKFWQFLLIKDLPKDSLIKLQFTLFGLGDSSYPKFNYAGRKLRSRLLQLSAKEFLPSAFGDEQHPCGIDTEFIVWLNQLTTICTKRNNQINYIQLKPTDQQIIINKEKQIIYKNCLRLSAQNHNKETFQFIFQSQQQYECGDIISIKPQNNSKLVTQFLDMMQLKNQTYQVEQLLPNQKSKIIPQTISLNQLFTEYIDLSSPPNRYFIYQMSQYAQNDIHKQKLKEMCSQTPEGLEEYYSYVYREKRNVVEVLYDFQPCVIPLNQLVDALQLIRERQYSISSCYNGQDVSITVALVSYRTAKNRLINGFCSNYLKHLDTNDKVTARFIKGSVQFPKDPEIPIIMVGPGTGVAPFIGFIEYRIKQSCKNANSTLLFFGTCYKDKEFYYEQFLKNAPIRLFTAFSRDQQQKIYVQHRILENNQLIKQLVNENLDQIKIFITGTSRKMPSQVEQVFKEILGERILKQLITKKQYIVECW